MPDDEMPAATDGGAAVPERIAQFRILGVLGQGGMGVVYRAHDESLRRDVALKLLPETGDGERRQRFLREARSAAAITHPNVAVLYLVGEEAGRVYIAMELIEGESLRRRLQRGPLDVATALDLARQMAQGLAAAHDRGIVHRDLKPENVMITPAGVVKLLDFGVAKGAAEGSRPGKADDALAETETVVTSDRGRLIGTPEYMSPEQATGQPVDVRSDVFSFGIVLYEMLAGVRPFAGPSTGAVLVAIARDPAPPLRERARGVDEGTEAIVTRCLAKDRESRFAHAGELATVLAGSTSPRAVTVSGAVAAVPSMPPQAPGRGTVKNVALFGLVLLAVLGGIFVAGAAGSLAGRRSPAASTEASASAQSGAAPSPDDLPSRSSNAEAERRFEEAMQALHDDTGQAEALLERAVAADASFGGAYLRLWFVSGTKKVEYHQRLVAVESTLSRRDRELMQCLEDSGDAARARLDAFLGRYPDDDVAWLHRIEIEHDIYGADYPSTAVVDRALAARPTLARALAVKAQALWTSPAEAREVTERCVAASPHAVGCLGELLQRDRVAGDCAALEKHARQILELNPDSFDARQSLASVLAMQGASADAVRDALRATARDPAMTNGLLAEALVPMLLGDFPAAENAAQDHLAQLPASATEEERWAGYITLVFAHAESGDDAAAGRVAADYLSRRKAWRGSNDYWVGFMIGAALRGHRLDPAEGERMLRAAYEARLSAMPAPDAWATVYALSSYSPAEARAAIARLDALGISPASRFEDAPSFVANVLALGGQAAAARPILERDLRMCGKELTASPLWLRNHLRLGELDEQAGDASSACAHYATVVSRWGRAKPRSVTADEARARADRLRCTAR